jgi:FHA domain
MEAPHIQIASTGAVVPLQPEVTTIGRGKHADVQLSDPSVSLLHAEIVRRGPYAYVMDLGLSQYGTKVNGRLVARRVLADGDALTFGSARCRITGLCIDEVVDAEPPRSAAPELTRRELDVIAALCRPAMSDDAFITPATAREIAADLVVTEAAVKQHLLRLYTKLKIPEGQNRRIRLANEVVALGLARPELPEPDEHRGASPVAAVSPTFVVPRYPTPALASVRHHSRARSDQRGVIGRNGGPA